MRIEALFPTLIGEVELPGFQSLNPALASAIRQRERQEAGQAHLTSVKHGWQSDPGFLETALPELATFRELINRPLEAYLAEWGKVTQGPGAPQSFRYRYRGWSVILRPGGFQHEHVHSRSDVVGVYWVEVPPSAVPSGELCLVDPRAGRLSSRAIWENTQVRIPPRAGTLVLFPSFMPHRVDVVQAEGERLSINFDVFLEPN